MPDLTFGDILDVAERHFGAAEALRGQAIGTAGTVRALHRLVTAMARSLGIITTQDVTESAVHPEADMWRRTVSDLREGLLAAADAIDAAAESLDPPGFSSATDPAKLSGAARHLASAASALNAGCDLLGTHTTLDSEDVRVPRSDWAHLLTSKPIAAGLAIEMTAWSRRAASWADRLTPAGGQPGSRNTALITASERLWAASQVTIGKNAAAGRDLLRGFPLATPPDRRVPDHPESTADLYAGIAASAERLRAIAFTMPQQAATSPDISAHTWRYTSHAAAIVSQLGSLTLQALAKRAAQLGQPAALTHAVGNTASAMATAKQAWEQAPAMWRSMKTDTQTKGSPATTETSDLVLRIGRLVFADPLWTPAQGPRAQLRDPASMAADTTEFRLVLAAVHQAADALSRMAAADLTAISAVGSANRFYMPETILWSPHPQAQDYSAAPRDRVMLLQDVYQVIVNTSQRAARALDDLALDPTGPSRIIALARKAAAPRSHPRLTDPELTLEDLQPRLKYFTRIRNGRAAGQADLDADAVIRAYTERHLSLTECAHRFTASEETIRAVLKHHGIPIRPSSIHSRQNQTESPPARSNPDPPPAPSRPTDPAHNKPIRGPVERTVRAMKVEDPRLLLRAAALDKAAVDLVTQARQSPAKLAAQDTPGTMQQPARPPESAPTSNAARRSARSNPRRSGARR